MKRYGADWLNAQYEKLAARTEAELATLPLEAAQKALVGLARCFSAVQSAVVARRRAAQALARAVIEQTRAARLLRQQAGALKHQDEGDVMETDVGPDGLFDPEDVEHADRCIARMFGELVEDLHASRMFERVTGHANDGDAAALAGAGPPRAAAA